MKLAWWTCFFLAWYNGRNICNNVDAITVDPKATSKSCGNGNQYFAVKKVFPPLKEVETNFCKKNGNSDYKSEIIDTSKTAESLILPYSKLVNHRKQKQKKKRKRNESLYPEPLKVLYTNHPKTVQRWLEDNLAWEGSCSLGFDVESAASCVPWISPSFFGPATIQLATPRSCLVVHMVDGMSGYSRSETCVPLMEALLSDETIVKAGCSIDDDMVELHENWNGKDLEESNEENFIDARSRFDLGLLQPMSTSTTMINQGQRLGLKTLTRFVLGLDLVKSKRIILSDWSRTPLSDAQIAYSARDAWAAAAILEQLELHDPANFKSDRLVQRLQSQLSIEEVIHEKSLRRRVRLRKKMEKLLNKRESTGLHHDHEHQNQNRNHFFNSSHVDWVNV